ncbi:MAG: hypothetical protein SFW36_02635, partial [Leptolyngbyaceae cyanobacterium bins.59]|nr:hypothetical protein [Leptolyngbyaceae cyanobacterium bins.59]
MDWDKQARYEYVGSSMDQDQEDFEFVNLDFNEVDLTYPIAFDETAYWEDGEREDWINHAPEDTEGEDDREEFGKVFNSQLWLYVAGVAGLAIGFFPPPVKAMSTALLDFRPVPPPTNHRPVIQQKSPANPVRAHDSPSPKDSLATSIDRPLELNFNVEQLGSETSVAKSPNQIPESQPKPGSRQLKLKQLQLQWPDSPSSNRPLQELFLGDTTSLVAKAVGAAEGTRTPSGQRTQAYYGHHDPGNGVWNLGTFSYQHGARSPQEADRKQLQRLERQAQVLRRQAATYKLELSLAEELNGIDLANQSPRAALDRGYIKRLKQAREKGLTGSEAVIWARTHAYQDPETGRWNAPGLGNTPASIRRDQRRRYEAVRQAIAAHQANTD